MSFTVSSLRRCVIDVVVIGVLRRAGMDDGRLENNSCVEGRATKTWLSFIII